jgi:hypothetical protein
MDSNTQSMIDVSVTRPHAPSPTADRDAKFLQLLPGIERQAAYHLRHLSPADREEAIQDVVVHAFVSYVRLTERGQAALAFASPLAHYGACRFLAGRRVGQPLNRNDVSSEYCRRRTGVQIEPLQHFDAPNQAWQELAVEDRHAGPAEVAAIRIDFGDWLESLPERTRRVAESLTSGETTSAVARVFGLTPGRISQLRRELYTAWRVFQHDVVPEGCSPAF